MVGTRISGRTLAWASVCTALVGLAAFFYTGRFGDTAIGVALVYACGPATVVLAGLAWWRSGANALRALAALAVLLAVALMVMLGYAVWWATTQSR